MPIPEWVDRLRPGVFTSPSGVVSNFKIDLVERVGGKKASNHEILNKNESIPQDQGNRAITYPIQAYFTGDNGDTEADTFFDSLGDNYTVDNPGILKHPRWGDIAVMPFEFRQSENLIAGAGIFRVPVEFRATPQSRFPVPEGIDQSEISADITAMEEITEEANLQLDIEDPSVFAEFRARINEEVAIISNAIGGIADTVDEIGDTFRLIQDDIDSALVIGADAVQIMSQVNTLIRLPSQIIDNTLAKVQSYEQMIQDISNSFADSFGPSSNNQVLINDAVIFQDLGFFGTSITAEAALFTDYETRDAAGDALDFINDAFDSIEQRLSEIYQLLADGVITSFESDHNTGLAALLINGDTNSILIDRSFDLKAKQTVILSGPSDAITETWRFYQDMTQLEFFIRTNNLQDNEILEIAGGREIIAYV